MIKNKYIRTLNEYSGLISVTIFAGILIIEYFEYQMMKEGAHRP